MSKQTFVIVGASLAGAKAAEELRSQGFDGRVVLLGGEAERPYERPPLTKDYLRGESEREKAYVHAAGFYADNEIELETATTVTAIDPAGSRVTLDDGRTVEFDRLLLTTGAEPRRIPVDGAGLDGVYYLRTFADCDALRGRLDAGGRVVVVGAGWIGSEFAASARQRGLDVTIVDPLALPNERIFGPEIGSFYRDVHAQHGVELVLGDSVEAFAGDKAVGHVRTSGGREIDCDFVVVGIGVAPCVELARDAGLEVDDGILVDEKLQTSTPNVFAAGDVARASHPFYGERVRVEHWSNALNQGPAAARAMLGEPTSYDRIPGRGPSQSTTVAGPMMPPVGGSTRSATPNASRHARATPVYARFRLRAGQSRWRRSVRLSCLWHGQQWMAGLPAGICRYVRCERIGLEEVALSAPARPLRGLRPRAGGRRRGDLGPRFPNGHMPRLRSRRSTRRRGASRRERAARVRATRRSISRSRL
jgi:3-phenylpropionate/trans-cinnamate dioxygenase ferredoxin reductase component